MRNSAQNPENVPTIEVTLKTIGGEVKRICLNGDRTVREALRAGGFPENAEVRVDGRTYGGDAEFDGGEEAWVLANEKVKGGSF